MNTISDATVNQASAMSRALWYLLAGSARRMPDQMRIAATGTEVESAWLVEMIRDAQRGITTIALYLNLDESEVTLHSIYVFRPCDKTKGHATGSVYELVEKQDGSVTLRAAAAGRPHELYLDPNDTRLQVRQLHKKQSKSAMPKIKALRALVAETCKFMELDLQFRGTR